MSYEKCPFANESCKYFSQSPRVAGEAHGCFADDSHQYWPAADYRTKREKTFVSHFMEAQCRRLHDEYHTLPPPDKPAPAEMQRLLAEYPRGQWNPEEEGIAL